MVGKKEGIRNKVAPEGFIWVCVVCGKRSRDRYGNQPVGETRIDRSWDESCMLNAELCEEKFLVIRSGRVVNLTVRGGR